MRRRWQLCPGYLTLSLVMISLMMSGCVAPQHNVQDGFHGGRVMSLQEVARHATNRSATFRNGQPSSDAVATTQKQTNIQTVSEQNPLRYGSSQGAVGAGKGPNTSKADTFEQIRSGHIGSKLPGEVSPANYTTPQEEIFLDERSEASYAQTDADQGMSQMPNRQPRDKLSTPYNQERNQQAPQTSGFQGGGDAHSQGYYQNQSSMRGEHLQMNQRPATLTALDLRERNIALEKEVALLQRNNASLAQELNENNELLNATEQQISNYFSALEQQNAEVTRLQQSIDLLQKEKDGMKRQFESEIKTISDELDKLLLQKILD